MVAYIISEPSVWHNGALCQHFNMHQDRTLYQSCVHVCGTIRPTGMMKALPRNATMLCVRWRFFIYRSRTDSRNRARKRLLQLEQKLQVHMDMEDRRVKELTEGVLYDFLPAALNVLPIEEAAEGREMDTGRCRVSHVAHTQEINGFNHSLLRSNFQSSLSLGSNRVHQYGQTREIVS